MLITKEWLDRYRTELGSYNKTQIVSLGMEWPPRKGWEEDIIGFDIDPESARKFEVASGKRWVCLNEIEERKASGEILIWTDEACSPNPGIGRWG